MPSLPSTNSPHGMRSTGAVIKMTKIIANRTVTGNHVLGRYCKTSPSKSGTVGKNKIRIPSLMMM
eukprot:8411293-Ditylum_brightwellii.AAC.1